MASKHRKPGKGRASKAQQHRRAFLDQPIVPGSSISQRELGTMRHNAVIGQFGANAIPRAQQEARDVAGWYQQYVDHLKQHSQNVAGYQDQAVGSATGLQGAAQGLSKETLATLGEGVSSENKDVAGKAAATRQKILGDFGSLMASQGASNKTYADTLANVVGPGQQLVARAQERQKVADRRKEIGAFRQQFNAQTRQDEAKNVLAAQALGLDTLKANADINLKRGVDPVTGRPLPRDKKSPDVITSGPFAGYTKREVTKLSPQQKDALKRQYAKGGGKGGKGSGGGSGVAPDTAYARRFFQKYGVKPQPTSAVAKAQDTIRDAGQWLKKLSSAKGEDGKPLSLAQLGDLLSTGQAASKDSAAVPKLNRLMVRVAMDLKQYGYVTPGTASRLHKSGYSVKALGLKGAPGSGKPSGAGAYPDKGGAGAGK